MADWTEFVGWAKKLLPTLDLTAAERTYKLKSAESWGAAMAALQWKREEWPTLLKRAAGSGNLVDAFAQTWLRNAVDAQPDAVRSAFSTLTTDDAPAAIDTFADSLRGVNGYVSPGDLTTFASLVRFARDPESHPPYRAQFVTDWGARVGVEAGGTPRERYEALLDLCDGLVRANPELPVADRLDAQGLAWAVMKYEPPVRWTPLEQAQLLAWRRGDDSTTASVDRGQGVAPTMEAGAWAVLGAGLRGEPSSIDPDVQTWTIENARNLRHHISTDPGGSSWMDKLAKQMAGADDPTLLLLAELVYLRNAPVLDMKASTKIERVNTILNWGSIPRTLSHDLADALEGADAFTGGQGYHAQTPSHMLWLTRFVEHWLEASDAERRDGLRDPFAFRDIVASTPDDVPSIRYVIEYLAWPGIFPSIVSADHRSRISKGLISDLGEPSGADDRAQTHDLVALQDLHRRKEKGKGEKYHWYKSPYLERWNKNATIPPKAWIVRPSEGGKALVDAWVADGFVSLSAKMLGTVEPGAHENAVAQAVKEGYTHLDASQREATTAAYHAFLSVMKDDDIVATIEGGQLRVGIVTGPAHYVGESGSRLRREAQWSPTPVDHEDLAAPLPSLLDQQGAVVDATVAYDILASLIDAEPPENGATIEQPKEPARPAVTPKLPAVTDAVASSLHMDRTDLQEIVDLLQQRQQVVLYGPPGTGKTYLAKEIAKHLVADPSSVRLVQFHPSYSYEDFFEGYRPTQTESGHPTFELKDGPLRLLAAEASNPENRDNAYILIIDEMNRANIAKVFGELYFLLEYRNETVRLQYQPVKPFQLPPNLFIIGTMNTSDRSIALVDAAIRRRFPFVELHPSETPVLGVLQKWMTANHITDNRAELLGELNRRMGEGGRDLQIGPSYLMRSEIRSDADIDRVWRYDILPLLEEHYYGQLDRTMIRERFGIAAMRKAIASLAGGNAGGQDSDDDSDDNMIDFGDRSSEGSGQGS